MLLSFSLGFGTLSSKHGNQTTPSPRVLAMAFALIYSSGVHAADVNKTQACGRINYCLVSKNHWTGRGWQKKTLAEKHFEHPCGVNAEQMNFEKGGINISTLSGDSRDEGWRKDGYVQVDIFTNKLTYVVASASAPSAAPVVHFEHRLEPNGKDFIAVTCKDTDAKIVSGDIIERAYTMSSATRAACDKKTNEIADMLLTKRADLPGKSPFSIQPPRLNQTVTWTGAPFKALARYNVTLKSADEWDCDYTIETSILDEGKCGFESVRFRMCAK